MLKKNSLGLFFFFCIGTSFAHAQDFFNSIASPQMEILAPPQEAQPLSPGHYPRWVHWFYEHVLDWDPVPTQATPFTSPCQPELWQKRLLHSRNSVSAQAQEIKNYFSTCALELRTGTQPSFWNSFRMMSMRLDFNHHPFIRKVVFHLPGGTKLKGLLAMKRDRAARPLVVVRPGIFSSVDEFLAERYLLIQMFEQAPFNFLILENMTSPDFVAKNPQFSFGGYDEGLQNIFIAKLLKSPQQKISALIHSVHFIGVSLGGHGVLFASLLNDLNNKPIDSFLGLCPVVHLQDTLATYSGHDLQQKISNWWSAWRLQGLRKTWPELNSVHDAQFMGAVAELLNQRYRSSPPVATVPAGKKSSFWELNDFWPQYTQVASEVLVLATQEDPIVPFALNAGRLQQKNISVVPLPLGIHCSFAIPYHWQPMSMILQTYVLSHAVSYQPQKRTVQMELSEDLPVATSPIKYDLYWPPGKTAIEVRFLRNSFLIPLEQLDFNFAGVPLEPATRLMAERWLRQNLKIEVRNKRQLELSW